ncbi:hypothetical protein [Nostoc sp. WHI]|uniref:hypothetical protein n=1 Tax=Nostoc sp. WHI TaxID=2650611 RepID=UPI0018C76C4D|nr:hypothetical protein [Nostoc sp. WHI]MBG1267756.1 hypothetical protein [Nostoc sp. WHI]
MTHLLAYIYENFSRSEATGLNCLIFLALHRETTVLYQRQTMGFSEVPSQVIQWCDQLEGDDLLEVAKQITLNLLEVKVSAEAMDS